MHFKELKISLKVDIHLYFWLQNKVKWSRGHAQFNFPQDGFPVCLV